MRISDERLRQKLVQAGYTETDVSGRKRADLLAYYSQILLAETACVPQSQRGDDVDVRENEGDGEEIEEAARNSTSGFFDV